MITPQKAHTLARKQRRLERQLARFPRDTSNPLHPNHTTHNPVRTSKEAVYQRIHHPSVFNSKRGRGFPKGKKKWTSHPLAFLAGVKITK